ncbi:MAG: DoxX family protein [Haloferacaceae archaeon]
MAVRDDDAEESLLGDRTELAQSRSTTGYALLGLRLVMGWVFFHAGITKVLDPSWTARGYLTNVPAANPFGGLWATLARPGYLAVVDPLNAWGLTLVGAALLLGAAVRWAALWGAVMMAFYWASSLPLAHAVVVDSHVVYAVLLFGLGAFGAGRVLGVDGVVEETDLVERHPRLRYLLG